MKPFHLKSPEEKEQLVQKLRLKRSKRFESKQPKVKLPPTPFSTPLHEFVFKGLPSNLRRLLV